MSNAEIEVCGTGRVLAIEDSPPLADGEGSVVISRIKTHHAGKLVELHFENGESLTGTASHPIWSADRQDWVPLGELQEGEHTQSRDGLLRITRRIALPDMQPVYNLEVHGEHVYEVTQAGVLVHNNDCLDLAILRAKQAANTLDDPAEIARLAALEQKVLNRTLADPAWRQSVADSGVLGDRLGKQTNDGLDAHHIVAGEHRKADGSRAMLDHYQIDINSAENGVLLVGGPGAPQNVFPRRHHGGGLHSFPGIYAVTDRLRNATLGISDWGTGRQAVISELAAIRAEILAGTFP